VPPGIRGQQ